MTPNNFLYWLKGFLELNESKEITSKQVELIKKHLELSLSSENNFKQYKTTSFDLPIKLCDTKQIKLPQNPICTSERRYC